MSPRTAPLLLAAAALLAAPAAAPADSLVYTDAGDVWAADADGGAKRRVTVDGAPALPPAGQGRDALVGPYAWASADDAGRVLAVRAFRELDSEQVEVERPTFVWMNAAGARLAANSARVPSCVNQAGPVAARVNGAGTLVAFNVVCFGHASPTLAVWSTDRWEPGTTHSFGDGWQSPTWWGERLVADGANGTFVQPDVPQAPYTGFDAWLVGSDGSPNDPGRAEVTRDGARVVVNVANRETGSDRGWVFTIDGPPPDGGVTPRCELPSAGTPASATWSPDGSRIAWVDDEGLKVARLGELPVAAPGPLMSPCPTVGAPALVSAGGRSPSFTPADVTGPVPPDDPPPPPQRRPADPDPRDPERGRPQAARLALALPARATVAQLRRGVAVTVRVPGRGRLTVRGTVAGRRLGLRGRRGRAATTVLAASARPARAGRARLTLRAPRAVRARLARLRGASVAIGATYAPSRGRRQTARATLRVR